MHSKIYVSRKAKMINNLGRREYIIIGAMCYSDTMLLPCLFHHIFTCTQLYQLHPWLSSWCCVWFTDVCVWLDDLLCDIWYFSVNRIADEIKHCKSLHFLNPERWCYVQHCLKTHCLWLYRGFLKAWDQQASIGHLYHQSDHMVVLSPSSSTRRMLQLSAPAVPLLF